MIEFHNVQPQSNTVNNSSLLFFNRTRSFYRGKSSTISLIVMLWFESRIGNECSPCGTKRRISTSIRSQKRPSSRVWAFWTPQNACRDGKPSRARWSDIQDGTAPLLLTLLPLSPGGRPENPPRRRQQAPRCLHLQTLYHVAIQKE